MGRASLDGERPEGGRGEDDLGGGPEPTYFFWINVREKIACERDDCAFMSVSFVLLIEVPCRIKLNDSKSCRLHTLRRKDLLHDLTGGLDVHFSQTLPKNMTLLILPNLYGSLARIIFHAQQVDEIFVINLYERALNVEIPRATPFFLELSTPGKDVRDSSGNNTHPV